MLRDRLSAKFVMFLKSQRSKRGSHGCCLDVTPTLRQDLTALFEFLEFDVFEHHVHLLSAVKL